MCESKAGKCCLQLYVLYVIFQFEIITVRVIPKHKIILILMLTDVLIFITLPVISIGIKITRFEVPSLVVPGDSAVLTCFYDLRREKLYSVKWFKDHVEFFRFFPSLSPQFMAFPAPGLDIDVSRSSPTSVYLRNLTLKSEGQYTCQVSADEPYFGCVQVHREVVVYIPPESTPRLYGEVLDFGDNLTVHCSSAKSKPAANLSWYVNDVLMDSGVVRAEVIRHPDRLETSSSSLNVPWHHLPAGNTLRLSCAASIADLITSKSNVMLITRPDPEKVLELKNSYPDEQWRFSIYLILCIFMVMFIIY